MKNFILGILFTLAVLYPQYSIPKIQAFLAWSREWVMMIVHWMAAK
jgi:hypothetical protein